MIDHVRLHRRAFERKAFIVDSAALDAVRRTPFTPAMNKGRPVAAWIQIDVNFRLE